MSGYIYLGSPELERDIVKGWTTEENILDSLLEELCKVGYVFLNDHRNVTKLGGVDFRLRLKDHQGKNVCRDMIKILLQQEWQLFMAQEKSQSCFYQLIRSNRK